MMKPIYCWLLAIIITLAAVFFQRDTGPTKPVTFSFSNNDTSTANLIICPRSLVRSDSDMTDLRITVKGENIDSATLYYKRYPTSDSLRTVHPSIEVTDGNLLITAQIPTQPTAGKIEYRIDITFSDSNFFSSENVILRFRNNVPAPIMILHILFMYLSLLLSVVTGLYVFVVSHTKRVAYNKYALATLLAFLLGGFVFGPLLQYYAFGVYWSGWPLGGDLTDNKTLFAFIIWLAVLLPNLFTRVRNSKYSRYLYLFATLVTLAIFIIPHSANGSEYDYKRQEVVSADR